MSKNIGANLICPNMKRNVYITVDSATGMRIATNRRCTSNNRTRNVANY